MRGHTRPDERGVALLTVITALVALMVIAVPFAITMRMGYERSRAHNARTRAQNEADSVLRFLKAYLVRTTERVEIENREAEREVDNADPEVDTQREFTPTLADIALALGRTEEELQDPYGTIVGWEVEDENGKLNLNGASFFALGNLLGLSVITEKLEAGARDIVLEDATAFPERGFVKIGRELVKYGGKEGNRLVDCERGLAAGTPDHGQAETYNEGQWVVNYAAWAISYYAVARHPGEHTVFDSLDVSDITRLSAELPEDVPVITQAEWERVQPFVTVWSKGEIAEGWTNVQPVVEGTSLPSGEGDADAFNFGNSYYYNCGTIVRLSEKAETNVERDEPSFRKQTIRPRRRDYAMVFDAQPSGSFESRMDLFGKVHRTFDGNQMRVQYRPRQPINVNTAPREVLLAAITHLQYRGKPETRVTPENAGKVVDAILAWRKEKGAVQGFEALKELLDEQVQSNGLTLNQRNVIYRNALNSHDAGLVFGTAPFCFRTFDVYTLRVTATIANQGGLLAKHSATAVEEIGSQLTTSRTWETQRDFEEQLVASQDPRFWTSGPINTGRFLASHIEPWPRWPKQLYQHQFPWDPYRDEQADRGRSYRTTELEQSNAAVNGDIRLQPSRAEFDTALEDSRFVEHFDGEDLVEGRFVQSGFSEGIGDGGSIVDTVSNDQVQPFAISFWWQPQAATTSNPVLFDYAEAEFRNRYSCYVDSGSNELVFAVADATTINRASEIRYDLSELGGLQQDVWYHIQCVAAGCHPSKMALIVDGRAVGQSNILTHLTGGVSVDGSTLGVEDASGFPETGAVLVGNEVIEYQSRDSGQLVVRQDTEGNVVGRGARGTLAAEHDRDTPVVLFGYSRPLSVGMRTGGATTEGEMGPWSPVQLATNVDRDTEFATYNPSPAKYDINLGTAEGGGGGGGGGGGEETPPTLLEIFTVPFEEGVVSGFTVRAYGADAPEDATVEDQLRAFQQEGYALVCYIGGVSDSWENFDGGGRDQCRGIVEFVKYSKTDNTAGGLTIERLSDNDGAQSAPEREDAWEILLGYRKTGGTVTDGIVALPTVIIPVSVRATETNADSYLNPVEDDDFTHWLVQLLFESGGGGTDIWEWVRYSELLTRNGSSFFLQARVPNEALLWDTALAPDFDDFILDLMLQVQPGGGEEPGGDPGTDPGGEPPDDGGGGGGGGGGGVDPRDPPTAPPSDGPGGDDPGPDPGDGDGGPPADDGPGGDPLPPDPGPGDGPVDDGPGGDPVPDTPPEDGPTDDGPGGDDPGEIPDGGETPPDDGGGGDPLPPSEGGPPVPPGDGEPPSDPGDEEPPTEEPVEPPTEADEEGFYINASAEGLANLLRFRGVQSDRDRDGRPDDWWGKGLDGDDALVPDEALVLPVAACYPGPEPLNAGAGSVTEGSEGEETGTRFSMNPLPGFGDHVTIITGDGNEYEGDDLTVFWAMTSTDRRLYDTNSFGGGGTIDPYDMDVFSHLFAFNRQVRTRYDKSDDVAYRKASYQRYTRIDSFPSGNMPDEPSAMSRPRIGASFNGAGFPCVLDEIWGAERTPRFRLTLRDETLNESDTTIAVISEEGIPAEADVPEGPGVLRIGEELVVYRDAEISGGALQFNDCVRGVLRTTSRSYERGAPVEALFGMRVGLLSEASADSSNAMVGEGFRRFPRRLGCVRLESADGAELRIYTSNDGRALLCPVGDTGAAVFNGRYGSGARTHESGTPVFWHPVRSLDLFAEFSDDPYLSFFSISTQLNGALVKRFYWEEGQLPPRTNIRAIARINEGAPWNATSQRLLYLSRDGDAGGYGGYADRETKIPEGESPVQFLRAMEDPQGDNLFNMEANTFEVRFFVVYESNAYLWENPAEIGWKTTPRIESASLEYTQQNMTLNHVDAIR